MAEDKKLKNDGKGTAVGNTLRWLAKQGKTFAPELLDMAGSITGIGALDKLGDAIRGDKELSEADKELLIKQLELDIATEQEVTKRWEADLHSDSKLSKNIRPITLIYLMSLLTVVIILEGFGLIDLKESLISLLATLLVSSFGGYFVIRGGEKIVNKVRSTKK